MRSAGSLSLDLDDLWSYLKTHGDEWRDLPSYLPTVVPMILQLLSEHDLTITFFVVGQDATLPRNREVMGSIAAAGHEIANHSFHHEPWLHRYSAQEVDLEVARAEEAIESAVGVRPVGFRGPGYSLSEDALRTLIARRYLYDATILPTFIGPLGRAFYFRRSRFSPAERKERAALFGSFRDGFRPLAPYMWDVDGSRLLEIPVTTLPYLRLPFHVSYLLYLSRLSPAGARRYLALALDLCRLSGIAPSLLLHPLDLLGSEDAGELRFFPGMDLSRGEKAERVQEYLSMVMDRFVLGPVRSQAATLTGSEIVARGARLRKAS